MARSPDGLRIVVRDNLFAHPRCRNVVLYTVKVAPSSLPYADGYARNPNGCNWMETVIGGATTRIAMQTAMQYLRASGGALRRLVCPGRC